MADDFGDFTDFSSGFPSTTSATTSSNGQGSEVKPDGKDNTTDKVDNFFASFPSDQDPSSDVHFSFAFDGQLEGVEGVGGFANFDVATTNIADMHIPFDLPSPPGVDVHLAGGVPFDIPPLPGDDEDTTNFSSWTQTIENGLQTSVQHTDDNTSSAISHTAPTPSVPSEHPVLATDMTSKGSHSPVVGGLISSENIGGRGVQDGEEEFGNFESSLTFIDPKTLESVQNTGTTTTSANAIQLPPSDDRLKSKEDYSFGDFEGGGSDQRTQMEEKTAFGSGSKTKKEEEMGVVESSTPQFTAEFGTFEQTSQQTQNESVGNSDFGNFEAFTKSSVTNKEVQNTSQFADFGDFTTTTTTTTATTQFGDFETIPNRTEEPTESQTSNAGKTGRVIPPDFANFETAPSSDNNDATTSSGGVSDFGADFTAFQSTSNTVSDTSDDFGHFSAFSSTTQTATSGATTQFGEFGDFSGAAASSGTKEDEFGDFNTGSNEEFGKFSAPIPSFGDFSSAPAAPPPTSTKPDASGLVKEKIKANTVLTVCFSGTGSQQLHVPPSHTTTSLLQRLLKEQPSGVHGVWQVLQKCVDFTVPLHKWDNSYMQDNYYGALKIDPLLVSKPGVLPILNNGMAQFEAPLGGATAAEDLIESFGFQGDLEVSPTAKREFRLGSPGAPALLDLSLPASPTSPTNKDSFTLAKDLLGLDLNPQQQSQQLSSVEELVRNERLIVNKSTWVDSKLLEIGVDSSVVTSETTSSNNSRPSTPRSGKKQNSSVEVQLLQLGLDASKTTFASGSSNGELSLSARSVLGRLPDLSFMLPREEIVHSTFYSRSK